MGGSVDRHSVLLLVGVIVVAGVMSLAITRFSLAIAIAGAFCGLGEGTVEDGLICEDVGDCVGAFEAGGFRSGD